jgi:hypothetical protein
MKMQPPSQKNMKKTVRNVCAFMAISLVAACSNVPPQVVKESCESPLTLSDEIAALKVISIGEVHGTAEIPRAVGYLACSFLRAGKAVVLGLEIPLDEQAAIDAFIVSAGSAADKEKLLAGQFWRTDFPDGRSSTAIYELLNTVRNLKHDGNSISVIAFDMSESQFKANMTPETKNWEGVRNALMAANAKRAIEAAPATTFVLLSGTLHATKQETLAHDAQIRTMAHLLHQQHRVATFRADFASGKSWNCRRSTEAGKTVCGIYDARGYSTADGPMYIRIERLGEPERFLDFDGALFVGREVTASPRAVGVR